jgi:DNA-binding transcriptional ArsR family regulator
MDEKNQTSTLRAMAHPLRLRMLSLLTGAELSAAEVARELGITQANASYHLRVLLDVGELEVAGEEKIRGGVAKRYRHPWHRPARERRLEPAHLEPYVRAMAAELVRRYAGRQRGGPRGNLSDAEVWVDPATYDRARALVTEASELMHAGARPPRTEGTLRANLTVALFPLESA